MKRNISTNESPMVSEPALNYGNMTTPIPCQITVNIEDMNMLKEIKSAISMIRGVVSVESSPTMKSYEQALADAKAGRVVEFENLDALKSYYDSL